MFLFTQYPTNKIKNIFQENGKFSSNNYIIYIEKSRNILV